MKKILLIDMYGVILEESKGNFIPYTYAHFPQSEYDRITHIFRVEKLFTQAGYGKISSDEFLSRLGYDDPQFSMKGHIYEQQRLHTQASIHTFFDAVEDRSLYLRRRICHARTA